MVDLAQLRRAIDQGADAADDETLAAAARSLSVVQRCVAAVNVRLYKAYDADIDKAFGAVRGTALHAWLGEKSGRESLSLRYPLVYSYFARVGRTPCVEGGGSTGDPASAASEQAGLSSRRRERAGPSAAGDEFEVPVDETGVEGHCMACNGFIWGGESGIDFTLPYDAIPQYVKVLNRRKTMRFRQRKWRSRRGSLGVEQERKDADADSTGRASGSADEGGDQEDDEPETPKKETADFGIPHDSAWDARAAREAGHSHGPGVLRRIKTPTQSEMDELSGQAFGQVIGVRGSGAAGQDSPSRSGSAAAA